MSWERARIPSTGIGILLVLYCSCGRLGRRETIGQVSAIVGKATLIDGQSDKSILAANDPIVIGDRIEVHPRSKLKLQIGSGSSLYLNKSTAVFFGTQAGGTERAAGVSVHLERGEIYWHHVDSTPEKQGCSFTTANVSVQADGASCGIVYDSRRQMTALSVIRGSPVLTTSAANSRTLRSCRIVTVTAEGGIDGPALFTDRYVGLLKNWIGKTIVDKAVAAAGCFSPGLEPVNRPPQFTMVPREASSVGTVLHDTLKAEDPDGDTVRFELIRGPSGYKLDEATGVVRFKATAPGTFEVGVRALDNRGLEAKLGYTIEAVGGLRAVLTMPVSAQPEDQVFIGGRNSQNPPGGLSRLRFRFDVDGDGAWDYPPSGRFGAQSGIHHRYDTEGVYDVAMELRNTRGETSTARRTIRVNQPPVAKVKAHPPMGAVGATITFDASGSTDAGDSPAALKVRWDMDGDGRWDYPHDGTFTKEKKIRNFWDTIGTYRICAQVRDRYGAVSVDCVNLTIAKPVAIIELSAPQDISVGRTARFRVAVAGGGLPITDYQWDLDNDQEFEKSSDGPLLDTMFDKAGAYTIACRVRDKSGATAQKKVSVTVSDTVTEARQAPASKPEKSEDRPTRVDAGPACTSFVASAVRLKGVATDPDSKIAGYAWDVDGDGQFDWTSDSTGETKHTYEDTGTYAAVLRVTTVGGSATSDSTTVTVVANAPPVADAGEDIAGHAGRKVELNGSGRDPDGRIANYEWDFDGDGKYDWASDETGVARREFERYAHPILRVTDAEGSHGHDTVIVVICPKEMELVAEGPYCIDRYEWPNSKNTLPARDVTWDQAAAECRKAGKRLCSADEWAKACGGKRGHLFPYGKRYEIDLCNTVGNAVVKNQVAKSGYFDKCKSSYGVFDMSGNVAEWTAAQEGEKAYVLGGSWQNGENTSGCRSRVLLEKGRSYFYVGFRCCK
jgi:PKD repeat protein